jgi:hypothetical protein
MHHMHQTFTTNFMWICSSNKNKSQKPVRFTAATQGMYELNAELIHVHAANSNTLSLLLWRETRAWTWLWLWLWLWGMLFKIPSRMSTPGFEDPVWAGGPRPMGAVGSWCCPAGMSPAVCAVYAFYALAGLFS